MVKIFYLLAGIALKQAVDELKVLHSEYLDYLKRCREAVQTYRAAPAVEKGSKEAYQASARHQHRARVEPEAAIPGHMSASRPGCPILTVKP